MSENDASQAGASAPENPFDQTDLAQFEADDATAGKAIGKMLSLFFLFTIIATGIVGYWMFSRADDGADGKPGDTPAGKVESH